VAPVVLKLLDGDQDKSDDTGDNDDGDGDGSRTWWCQTAGKESWQYIGACKGCIYGHNNDARRTVWQRWQCAKVAYMAIITTHDAQCGSVGSVQRLHIWP